MTLLFEHEPAGDAPIVCDFSGATDTPEQRLAEYRQLFGPGLVSRERTGTGVVVTFDARLASWAADLAAREAACCPFLSYLVTLDDGVVRWETSGSAEAQPILDECHELYHTAATISVDDLIAGLAQRGFTVTRSSAESFQLERAEPHTA